MPEPRNYWLPDCRPWYKVPMVWLIGIPWGIVCFLVGYFALGS